MITATGLLSAGLAWIIPLRDLPWIPGFTYWLIPFGLYFINLFERRRHGRGILRPRKKAAAPSSEI